jgi:hypothetical protein
MEPRANRILPPALVSVEAVVHRARAALLTQARLDAAARGFFWSAAGSGLAIVTARLAGMSAGQAWWLLLIVVAGTLLGMLVGQAFLPAIYRRQECLRPRRTAVPDGYRVAKRIDEQLGLKDRLAGGYDLLRRARSAEGIPETPFTALILKDAGTAADEARRALRTPIRLPRGVVPGVLFLAAAAVLSLVVLPGVRGEGAGVSREQREQAQAFNESLDKMAKAIQAIEGLDDRSQKAMLDALRGIQISEDDLKKMSRADIIRRLREANTKIKIPEGVQGAALRQAVEDRMRAIAEMEQVHQQLAEIEAINRREAVIDLGDGRKTSAANIRLESSDLQIDQAIAAAAARPGDAEIEYQKRVTAAEVLARKEREKIKRFLAKTVGEQMPEADVQKLATMMANDAEFQAKVMEAIKDPSGKQFDAMRAIYRRQLEREFEKENIPRGLRQQLSTYLGR